MTPPRRLTREDRPLTEAEFEAIASRHVAFDDDCEMCRLIDTVRALRKEVERLEWKLLDEDDPFQ